jgi:hypothetical protein
MSVVVVFMVELSGNKQTQHCQNNKNFEWLSNTPTDNTRLYTHKGLQLDN